MDHDDAEFTLNYSLAGGNFLLTDKVLQASPVGGQMHDAYARHKQKTDLSVSEYALHASIYATSEQSSVSDRR